MVLTRRSMLAGLAGAATSAAAVCSHLWAPRHAAASDLSSSDRIDLLYSNQFHFNGRGEPQITIGLMGGQSRVRISAPEGIDVLPSGDGGTRIEGGRAFEIVLDRAEPAKQSFSVVLEELVGPHVRQPGPAIERWADRNFEVRDHEVGTVFGVQGHVLDNRRVLVCAGRYSSESDAMAEARRLKKKYGSPGKLHPNVDERGHGVMVARDETAGTRVQAEGVLWFAPRGKGPITVHDVVSGTTMGTPKREDRTYWGSIYVAIDRHGKLTVVNLVSETDVLAGLVPAEIFASAPMAALQAQAVAARGQLVGKVGGRHLDDPFLLCAEQHCQVYAGRGHEHPRTTKAVRGTAGWVAMRPGKTQLVDTVYSANSGGFTEHNEHVWPGEPDPQLRGRPDPMLPERYAGGIDQRNIESWLARPPSSFSRPPSESSQSTYRWEQTIDPAAVAGAPGVPEGLGALKGIEVLARGRSGRATKVRLVGSHKTSTIFGELRIRRALGSLKSSMFVVQPERDPYGRFVLRGGGHGHGVGMCQHGAMGMARAGRDFRQILAHYYRGTKVIELW